MSYKSLFRSTVVHESCPRNILILNRLGPVQDADRLDAIGAVGIGRAFTYGGAHGGRPLSDTMEIFTLKLEKLEALMKTEKGKELAKERTERLKIFKDWLADEQSICQ